MEILNKFIYALMLLSSIGIIILVLLQHGKGADMGTGFGAGASGSLFGATGSANFLSRMTAGLATVFFVCTLTLSWFASHRPTVAAATGAGSDNLPGMIVPAAPASAPPQGAPAGAVPANPAQKGSEIPK